METLFANVLKLNSQIWMKHRIHQINIVHGFYSPVSCVLIIAITITGL